MAPKRRRDAVAREIAKTYTFGRSQINKTDVDSLVKNRMVAAGQAPGRETVPQPWDNEVVIFRDLLYAGLRSPCTPPSSTFSGISTSTCTNSLEMPSYAYRCTCGYVGLRRSSLPPKGSLRRIKYTTSGGQSSKKRGTNLWRRTASSVV
jgi:hypothetical protein